ncbi:MULTISPECIES: M20 family metallopeptidase [unclassified Mesorhizobium]|uniref:M20 family metallopeptidase n=1 Tax=unclassified Mesorhizobium TaxID=325217 RepID=UPI0024157D2A|nr:MULTISPECIES: M20 family metallopeptidase [unclassified Mesorhizobium]MDG4889936.1 M20 family metallopeptidase [Mesorhizobium sp. WSM4887]MDG4904079.1 M20 family metallopeptidase [Mesorhizobium sp. WSM4962]MDG4909106.1 M20 family metallopeptidase [Mesorhizobium sp. WSM4898]MDG4921730.1 M20 family metallopeptidase [Mesorhizobium sp. WSM4989]
MTYSFDQGGRDQAIAKSDYYFLNRFNDDLASLVAVRSESQDPAFAGELRRYLVEMIVPLVDQCGFTTSMEATADGSPILLASRIENPEFGTILIYGHGDVCAPDTRSWREGLDPYLLTVEGDRIYGRGSADNKAQHLINLKALFAVLQQKGSLGFNVKLVMETSEEIGSPGLREFFTANADRLSADVLIASDGPRLRSNVPTMFLGSRAAFNFDLRVNLRERAYHSGNFGGLLADPAIILAHAISSIADARGQIRISEWRPKSLTDDFRASIASLPLPEGGPDVDHSWGEQGLTPIERAFGWNSFAVLSMLSGSPASPQNAIAGSAVATCQLRYVVGTDPAEILPALRRHLDDNGYEAVQVVGRREDAVPATRFPLNHPWVEFVADSIAASSGMRPDILPNLAGSLPNDAFTEILNLPTIWIPHSYAGCCQHAPNEHVLGTLVRDALRNMTGLFWDIGERRGKVR